MNILELFNPDPQISVKSVKGESSVLNLPKTSHLNSASSHSFLNLLSSIVKNPQKIDPSQSYLPALVPQALSTQTTHELPNPTQSQSSEPSHSPILRSTPEPETSVPAQSLYSDVKAQPAKLLLQPPDPLITARDLPAPISSSEPSHSPILQSTPEPGTSVPLQSLYSDVKAQPAKLLLQPPDPLITARDLPAPISSSEPSHSPILQSTPEPGTSAPAQSLYSDVKAQPAKLLLQPVNTPANPEKLPDGNPQDLSVGTPQELPAANTQELTTGNTQNLPIQSESLPLMEEIAHTVLTEGEPTPVVHPALPPSEFQAQIIPSAQEPQGQTVKIAPTPSAPPNRPQVTTQSTSDQALQAQIFNSSSKQMGEILQAASSQINKLTLKPSVNTTADTQLLSTTPIQQSNAAFQLKEPANLSHSILNLVQQIQERFPTQTVKSGSMELQLNPPSLGKVTLQITLQSGNVKVNLATQLPDAKAVLEQHALVLKNHLMDQGLNIQEFNISLKQNQQHSESGSSFSFNMPLNEKVEEESVNKIHSSIFNKTAAVDYFV